MKITKVSAYKVLLPLQEGSYKWSDSKAITHYDSTIVRIDTDAGITGWAEVCPLGPVYLAAYANGVRTGIREIAPALIGQDPLALDAINATMDSALKGHTYCKSPLDIACWDILGKHAGLPLCVLLGGRFGDDFAVYRSISQEPAEVMASWVARHQSDGFQHFQLKVGGVADDDVERIRAIAALMTPGGKLVCDANTGWLMHDALRVCRAVRDLDVYIEQPCLTYEECLTVRRHTDLPLVLDESILYLPTLLRAHLQHPLPVRLHVLAVLVGIDVGVQRDHRGDMLFATLLVDLDERPDIRVDLEVDIARRLGRLPVLDPLPAGGETPWAEPLGPDEAAVGIKGGQHPRALPGPELQELDRGIDIGFKSTL
jgi:cis-L-3-hydroxyproline dehydratase